MANPDHGLPTHGLQICPTRIDHVAVLFAHKVTQEQCQQRQREHYHKCFTCAYGNAFVARNGGPDHALQVERRAFVRAG